VRPLRKFLALSAAGRAIILRSLLLLPTVAVLLRLQGMARTKTLLGRLGRPAGGTSRALAPQEIARLVTTAASILGARCLPQSLVLQHLLRNRNVATEIRLGVSKLANGSLAAHAWIELDGLPLNDKLDVRERYVALPSSAIKFQVDRP
jgi:hypothetical protein